MEVYNRYDGRQFWLSVSRPSAVPPDGVTGASPYFSGQITFARLEL